ncbi:hypothetical protein GF314_09905 [bacterium]|nr:hypothetical protein [bacterium]
MRNARPGPPEKRSKIKFTPHYFYLSCYTRCMLHPQTRTHVMLHRPSTTIVQVALLLTLAVSTPSAAAWYPLAGQAGHAEAPVIEMHTIAPGTVELEISVPGIELTPTVVAGEAMVAVALPGAGVSLHAGAPELPVLARAIALPDRGAAKLEVIASEWRVVDHRAPVPSRGPLSRSVDPELVPRQRGAVYQGDDVWPAEVAELGRPFLVRDRRGVAVRIHPVRWDAGRGELQALTRLTVRVTTTAAPGINEPQRAVKAAPRAFGPLHRAIFGADSAAADKGADPEDEGVGYGQSERMLIVTAASLRSAVADLATWKRECGHLVEVLDMDQLGGSVLGLMDAIDERYFSDEGLAYLQLVGDVAQVPTRSGDYQGADSDGMYGLLSGDDLYVDVLVSRLPARNGSEAALMIDRIIAYERDLQAGAAWCARATGIASDEGDPSDYERCEWLRDDLLAAGMTDVARIYQGFGGDRTDIAASLNGGVGLVNYIGHGSGTGWLSVPFENADVHALTNTTAWPWIIDVACSNGDFSLEECFAESWLRSQHDGQPAGAVAMIAASTAASWVPPCVMQETMIDRLTQVGETELGALYTAGVASVLVMYEGLAQDQKLMEQYNLLGDASLRVRMHEPELLAVSHDEALPAGTAAWTLTAPAGARAVLTASEERLARVEVPDGGVVHLVPARPLTVGETVRLTVTADDAVTYRTDLPVVSAATPVDDEPTLPAATRLVGNHPNPFNPQTTVAFATAGAGHVRVTVLDARGRLVRELLDTTLPAGEHQVRWDGRDRAGRDVGAGVYLARLTTGRTSQVTKMSLVR